MQENGSRKYEPRPLGSVLGLNQVHAPFPL